MAKLLRRCLLRGIEGSRWQGVFRPMIDRHRYWLDLSTLTGIEFLTTGSQTVKQPCQSTFAATVEKYYRFL